ncbi:unnamed protein product [Effrenium voratum]|uniref:Uncharacterized protein n=1 Tax=Effrenium voratum TaxID=2562239 RepID=A0AA36IK99_9DINO|nr:unnamed protein product [Effrenium voratum]
MSKSGVQPASWRVLHARVIIRKAPSTAAGILGFHVQGKIVEGLMQDVSGTPWIKVKHHGLDGKECDGFMLIDGSAVGLGILMEKVETFASAADKAPAVTRSTLSSAKSAAKPSLPTKKKMTSKN